MYKTKLMNNKFLKKTLVDLLQERSVVTGKEVVQKIKEQEKRQKEFEDSV